MTERSAHSKADQAGRKSVSTLVTLSTGWLTLVPEMESSASRCWLMTDNMIT